MKYTWGEVANWEHDTATFTLQALWPVWVASTYPAHYFQSTLLCNVVSLSDPLKVAERDPYVVQILNEILCCFNTKMNCFVLPNTYHCGGNRHTFLVSTCISTSLIYKTWRYAKMTRFYAMYKYNFSLFICIGGKRIIIINCSL